jgi:hypothetical protein
MNFLIGAAIEAMAEAVTLGERYEVAPAKLMELITGTLFAAPEENRDAVAGGPSLPAEAAVSPAFCGLRVAARFYFRIPFWYGLPFPLG